MKILIDASNSCKPIFIYTHISGNRYVFTRERLVVVIAARRSLERVMTVSTSHLPGGCQSGKKSLATIPRQAHPSIINMPQQIVHNHGPHPPTKPAHVPSCQPLERRNANSNMPLTPMSMTNPVVVRSSIPRPSAHNPTSCKTPDTANVPIHE